jgi:hypothetical protein
MYVHIMYLPYVLMVLMMAEFKVLLTSKGTVWYVSLPYLIYLTLSTNSTIPRYVPYHTIRTYHTIIRVCTSTLPYDTRMYQIREEEESLAGCMQKYELKNSKYVIVCTSSGNSSR